ncbi:tyrosine-type recombinase/integrase [Scytonema sp. UIC 10036]|uniref:tyrosine-type recombinase/integrase n=1 Tax=Scytonema sp. UIC 10036 TaxID=2304196 RepID=UPI0012DA75E2|nr:tyrosine-type recombinase/integrase [Scytonema sp. UIC 10036]MUG93082.1 tyrosine-type recombinase/integrase [Scytonema sp. UIC 10036]
MKELKTTSNLSLQDKKWQFPIDVNKYNRNLNITPDERKLIQNILKVKSKRCYRTYKVLEKLLNPIYDVLEMIKTPQKYTSLPIKVILLEMDKKETSFWAWSEQEWKDILGQGVEDFNRVYKTGCNCRRDLIIIAYLLCNCNIQAFMDYRKAYHYKFAQIVFGSSLIDQYVELVHTTYVNIGHGEFRKNSRIYNSIGALMLANRSPYLENLTTECLEVLRAEKNLAEYIKRDLIVISQALTVLGFIDKPLKPNIQEGEKFGNHNATTDVASEWVQWCQRWKDTSTLNPKTRQQAYYLLLKIGRWLAQKHPQIVSPQQWTRDLAIGFVAAVDRMNVGDYIDNTKQFKDRLGKPLTPAAKAHLLSTARRFFNDCQEWAWISRKFNPDRALATPRSVRALIGPNPRVIADDIWAKLLWAGLNLTKDDLPTSIYMADGVNRTHWYPLEMVQAIVIIWLFAGLRCNEITRLRVGCVRWQKNDVIIPSTNEVVSKDAVCYLDIPVNKTNTAYTKPVDRVIGEAVVTWEKVRPIQPPTIDSKDGSIVHYLFFYRGKKIGETYINKSIIPMLCRKAGVPEKDARGNITSHRARSTIASQLANAKEPMTLLELKEWLGHRDVNSTINYTKVSPTKLAKSYQDAEYFKRNIRTIEVLIDQDAVKSGAAANGEPWMFYDLGHGYCTYDFFDSCQHRMACAKCNFYVPKNSSKAQILESKTNLQRMLQEIPLTDEERAAVEEGIEAMSVLSAKLADVPTPEGRTPRELGNA